MKWGILTAGGIANAFATGLAASKSGMLVATGARDLNRAKEFANRHGGRACGSYDEVLADDAVEAVYIATPHHLHAEWTIRAAEAGKAVLCEKPFTLDANEAARALTATQRAGVFFMEAFMYRCSPQTRKLVDLLQSGSIGKIRMIDADFGFRAAPGRTGFRFERALGGGGIMDVGTYCVSFARLVAGEEPVKVDYRANLEPGYDSYGAGVLEFPSGSIAKIACGVHLQLSNTATIYGEKGSIHLDDPWKSGPEAALTLRREGHDAEVLRLGCTGAELYAHEADAVAAFASVGECSYMTPADTLANMQCLDRIRESCGLTFEP